MDQGGDQGDGQACLECGHPAQRLRRPPHPRGRRERPDGDRGQDRHRACHSGGGERDGRAPSARGCARTCDRPSPEPRPLSPQSVGADEERGDRVSHRGDAEAPCQRRRSGAGVLGAVQPESGRCGGGRCSPERRHRSRGACHGGTPIQRRNPGGGMLAVVQLRTGGRAARARADCWRYPPRGQGCRQIPGTRGDPVLRQTASRNARREPLHHRPDHGQPRPIVTREF
mmetsp:Transcript_38120/g.86807  ORF Transcript_38120/g.86807 Transcript_38120/m.86807 type:complete len:228 (-) Transcript_38120:46-729(-)